MVRQHRGTAVLQVAEVKNGARVAGHAVQQLLVSEGVAYDLHGTRSVQGQFRSS